MGHIKHRMLIKHSLPERIRFKIYSIHHNEGVFRYLEKGISDHEGVTGVNANPASASLLVHYDHKSLTKADLIELLQGLLMASMKLAEDLPVMKSSDAVAKPHRHEHSIKSSLYRFIGLSAIMAIVFFREVALKRPFAQGLFSPLGIITTVLTLPLVLEGLKDFRVGRFTLKGFLGGSAIAANAAGEAKTDLEILWINSGATLLDAWISERSRRAIRNQAQHKGIEPFVHSNCEYILGKGVKAVIRNETVLVGNSKLMEQFSINTSVVLRSIRDFETQGLSTVCIAKGKTLLGVMGLANQTRPDAEEVVRYLLADGINEAAIITGDEECSALDLASRLNIDKCFDSILPSEKADIVKSLKSNGNKVLMVGDGINDALALAEADIGVGMGAGGAEAAIEAADIALIKDDLNGLVYARFLSQATLRVVHQNFWIATGSNLVGVALGTMGILSPVTAGFLHIIHTLGVLANSSRLLFYGGPRAYRQQRVKQMEAKTFAEIRPRPIPENQDADESLNILTNGRDYFASSLDKGNYRSFVTVSE
jgi:cation transport ATPase